MATELTKVMDWFCANLLLNYDKTQFLYMGPHYPKQYDKGEFVLQDLYDCSPLYLLNDEAETRNKNKTKKVYEKGSFTLEELHTAVPHYLTTEHIETEYGIMSEQPGSNI